MASWLIRVSLPPPWRGIKRPSPPRITKRPAKLFQKPMAGVRALFPARGSLPVGVNTESSDVSEKSFVSCSKTRGVNDMSPNPEWLCDVGVTGLFGSMTGKPVTALLRTTKGMLMIKLQATVKRRQERVGSEVAVAPRGVVERLSEREEPQPVQVAVLGIDPALPGCAARTVG